MNPNQQGYYQPDSQQPPQPGQPLPAQPQAVSSPGQQLQSIPSTPQTQPPAVPALQQMPNPTPEGELPVAAEQLTTTEPELLDGPVELSEEPVRWSALEYIHQEKGKAWFTIFGVVTVALLGVTIYFKQWSFVALIIVIVAVIIVSSKRPPRELAYALSEEGLSIDGKLHPFEGFKSFGIIRDGEEYSIMLIPTQRFQPGVTVYFPEEAGEDIVDLLGSRLPMKELQLDPVDRVVRFLRL